MDDRTAVTHTGEHVRTVEAGSTGEALMGAGAVVLGILGLIGLAATVLDAIACIAVGAGLLMATVAVARRAPRRLDTGEAYRSRQATMGSLAMAGLAGVAGVVLGILALVGIGPIALLSVSAIVLGAGLLMVGGARSSLESAAWFTLPGQTRSMRDVVYASSGSDVVIGTGAIVLGILALTGIAPLTLTLIAILALGAAILLGGSTIAAQLFPHFG